MDDRLTPSAAEAATLMEEELGAAGWTVRTTVVGSKASIEVQHPLSAPTSFNFDNDDEDHLAFIRRSLRHPEFAAVAHGPRESPNAGVIGNLRAAASTYRWDPSVLPAVASILRSHDLLTDDEAEWLARSGPTKWGE